MTASEALWRALARAIPPGTTGSVSFIVHVRSEPETLQVQGLLRDLNCFIVSVQKSAWPFGRPWRVAGRSAPMTLEAPALRRWSEQLLSRLSASDAKLSDWMLVPPESEGEA